MREWGFSFFIWLSKLSSYAHQNSYIYKRKLYISTLIRIYAYIVYTSMTEKWTHF